MNFKLIPFIFLIASFAHGQDYTGLKSQAKTLIESNDIEKAIPLLTLVAELGDSEAQYLLGDFYATGNGVEKDVQKAIEWFSKSAESGYNDAIVAMMFVHGKGDGVPQSDEKALSFALRCAENDHIMCLFNVINCYMDGIGTEINKNEFLKWAVRLGKLQNPEDLDNSGYVTATRWNLARMYISGMFIDRDIFLGYVWYLIFNESKSDFPYEDQETAINEIFELEAQLTSEQKLEGVEAAETLLGRPLKNIKNLHKQEGRVRK